MDPPLSFGHEGTVAPDILTRCCRFLQERVQERCAALSRYTSFDNGSYLGPGKGAVVTNDYVWRHRICWASAKYRVQTTECDQGQRWVTGVQGFSIKCRIQRLSFPCRWLQGFSSDSETEKYSWRE